VGDLSGIVEGAFVIRNLIGIPSYHFDPTFARVAAKALTTFRPSVVALELPDGLINELEWAASCWPGPVVSASEKALFPFVPGDSIFETFRLARATRIPLVLVDLPAADPTVERTARQERAILIGPELSRVGAGLFLEANDSLMADSGPPDRWNVAREAYMARSLTRLLAKGETVMWVGGMAHWTRIIARITSGNIDDASVDVTVQSDFNRMRIAPSALYRMTGRLPWLVACYGQDPSTYGEHAAMQTLCLEAAKRSVQETTTLVLTERSDDQLGTMDEGEASAPIDVARTLQYARNLAAIEDVRERPTFGELLTAAVATIGPKYAGRLYELAMNEQTSALALGHDALEWRVVEGREQYRCGDRIIESRPWWAPKGGLLLSVMEIHRRTRDEFFRDLPAAEDDKSLCWECPPNDESDYVSFVEYVLRRASLADPEEEKSAPFQTGLRDGLDVRATLRNWAEGTIYVREEQRGHQNFRNGAIDWINASEHSDQLAGKVPGGWIDPDLTQLGSCSRETREYDALQKDPWCQRDYRDFTFITLDAPTSRPTALPKSSLPTFYDCVIRPLVDLDVSRNKKSNLYEWLEIMFRFCAGKPFAYYSRYIPSPKVHHLAWQHKVHVVHFPLQRVPMRLLQRHKTFRFLGLTRKQWEEFQHRRSASAATWSG
jgi:hypothetical protein